MKENVLLAKKKKRTLRKKKRKIEATISLLCVHSLHNLKMSVKMIYKIKYYVVQGWLNFHHLFEENVEGKKKIYIK